MATNPYNVTTRLNTQGYTGQTPGNYTPNQFQNAMGYYWANGGPRGNEGAVASAQNQGQMANLLNQLQWGNAQYQYGSGIANRDYGIQNQLLGLQQQGNQLDVSGYQRQIGLQDQLSQLANQGFDLNAQAAQQGAGVATRNQISQGTANGSLQSVGTRDQLGDIQSQLQNQLGQIGVNRKESALRFQDTKAGLQQSIANANLLGKQFGIKGEQLKNSLQDQLDQLGLSRYTNAQEILSNYQNLSGQDQALMQSVIQQSLANAGYFPNTAAPTSGAGGGAQGSKVSDHYIANPRGGKPFRID